MGNKFFKVESLLGYMPYFVAYMDGTKLEEFKLKHKQLNNFQITEIKATVVE